MSGNNNDSPFFTCEIGVGTTAFYQRRAVVPEEMAGENINLRLGCGANREFGTLGTVMQETKKYNYFMNDFGTALAPAVAYLPTSNQDKNNLQWAVRLNENTGYLFCSNYLYKHSRKDYKNVQFSLKLKDEKIRMPRQKVTLKNGTCRKEKNGYFVNRLTPGKECI